MVDRTSRFLVSTTLDYKGSYTLVGSAGEHQPVAIGNLLLKWLSSKDVVNTVSHFTTMASAGLQPSGHVASRESPCLRIAPRESSEIHWLACFRSLTGPLSIT
jgi:hypothetical protein